MRSRYSQITVFVLNTISDVFTNVTYTVIICIKSSKEGSLPLCMVKTTTEISKTFEIKTKESYIIHPCNLRTIQQCQ